MDEATFKAKTKGLALGVIRLVDLLPRTRTADVLLRQLLHSGTSVGANYRAACRGKSGAGVIAKLQIVEEEADESLYWMELLIESDTLQREAVDQLMKGYNEVVAMTVASIRTMRAKEEF